MPPTAIKQSNPALKARMPARWKPPLSICGKPRNAGTSRAVCRDITLYRVLQQERLHAELAHQIAKGLADRVLGGRYEYVIGTHLNTGHIHSHIVWNSVSCVDGKKYRSNGKSYVTEIRAVSDELCRKYKLSVIDTENSNDAAKPYAEWLAEKSGQPTWRTAIRQDVDDAIQQSLTWRQFLTALATQGMKSAWGANIPFCAHPVKSALFDSKRWANTIRLKPFRRASYIHKLTARMSENSTAVQHGRLHSGKTPPQADRAAGAVLPLPVRVGRACPASRAVQVMPCGRMPTS